MGKEGFIQKFVWVKVLVLVLNVFQVICTGGFPKGFLNDIIESDVVKARVSSRWKWEVWDVVPGTHVFRLYVFNVTNPNDVEKGGKPILAELGPYAYIEHRIKFNVSVNMDLSVNYQRNFTYTFDPSNSNGRESDLINVLNVPLVIFSTIASRRGNIGNEAVNQLIRDGETLIKRQIKVGDFLFNGIDVLKYRQYTSILGDESSSIFAEFTSGTYAVLKMKRGANEGTFTVQSGLTDPSNIGQILKWNNEPELSFWSGTCNDIQMSTDGSVFQPYIDKDTSLQVLDDDLCRSIGFDFEQTTLFHAVNTYRFALHKNVLADPSNNSANICFCKNPGANANNCLRAGVLDVSSCREGVPLVMSFPHFLDSSPEYEHGVIGLAPIRKKHSTNIDVEPRLGAVIQYNRRLQWNIRLQSLANIDYFAHTNFMLFPILWNDDTFKLDDDKAALLISELANLDGYGGSANAIKLKIQVFMLCLGLQTTKVYLFSL